MKLEALRGLIVSIQPPSGSALDDPETIASLAVCALENGAVGVRIESARNISAVRKRLPNAAIVGLIKDVVSGFEPYITATLAAVQSVIDAGSTIVAFDATERARPDASTVADAVTAIHRAGGLAFADCARLQDARSAQRCGADILATTLHGYTGETRGAKLPALDLVREIAALRNFTVCEGGVGSPEQAGEARTAGADAVVVGTALTNLDALVRRYADAANLT